VQAYIDTRLHPKLILASEPTIRVWLYVVIAASKSNPLVATASGIAESMRRLRRTSDRAVSQAIRELEELGMIRVRRVGRAMEITVAAADERAAA
jgi:predicted transcriptional regulator